MTPDQTVEDDRKPKKKPPNILNLLHHSNQSRNLTDTVSGVFVARGLFQSRHNDRGKESGGQGPR